MDVLDVMPVREAREVGTSSGAEEKRKPPLVDCEQVHTDEVGVNQFNTGMAVDESQTAVEPDQ